MIDSAEASPKNYEYSRGFSLSVTNVTGDEIRQIAACYPDAPDIPMQDWVERSDKDPILNVGAGPCVSMYIRAKSAQRMISGHFIDVHGEDYQEYLTYVANELEKRSHKAEDHQVVSPTRLEIDDYGKSPLNEFEAYKDMLRRIKELSVKHGRAEMEAYLFGQNFAFDMSNIDKATDDILRRSRVVMDLIASGVPEAKIADHRMPGQRYFQGDDTLYVPAANTIFRSRAKLF